MRQGKQTCTKPAALRVGSEEVIICRSGLRETVRAIVHAHPKNPATTHVEQALWMWLNRQIEGLLIEAHLRCLHDGLSRDQFEHYLALFSPATPEERQQQYHAAVQAINELWPD